jgi:hypothetical protein
MKLRLGNFWIITQEGENEITVTHMVYHTNMRIDIDGLPVF